MIKNIFVLFVLCLSGCIVLLESEPETHQAGMLYMSDAYATCYYDAYWDLSEWYIEIYVNSNYHSQVQEVGYYINNHDYVTMDYDGDGWWTDLFYSNYYDCDRSLHFDFVAEDIYGYTSAHTLFW